jgi:hypothetical protein
VPAITYLHLTEETGKKKQRSETAIFQKQVSCFTAVELFTVNTITTALPAY